MIELRDVGKRYLQLREQAMLLRSLLPFARRSRTELWAVRHLDLTVAAGETIGILGRNGAGKSTLLRMLAGVTSPSEGEVIVRGRVAPLLSVGVGFHPEMSGRENVLVNGMLLGLSRQEIDDRFDDIVAFAELADFIDTPVKFYSSGMFMRLGFSVAVHTDPKLLLVDEVLAVGDVAFQLKCFDRMRALQETGATVVMVSHNMHAIRMLCPRVAVIANGQLEFDGTVEEGIGEHHRLLSARSNERGAYLHERDARGSVEIVDQELYDEHNRPVASAEPGANLVLRAKLYFAEEVVDPQVMFVVRAQNGSLAYRAQSVFGDKRGQTYRASDTAFVEVAFRAGFGGGGTFHLEVFVLDATASDVLGRSADRTIAFFSPVPGTFGQGDLQARLRLDGELIDEHPDRSLRAPGTN